jgi:hypothetical protein
MGHESSLGNLNAAYKDRQRDSAPMSLDEQKWMNSITALRLSRIVYGVMRDSHMDLDMFGFLAMCHIVENAAFGSWKLLREHQKLPKTTSSESNQLPWHVSQARDIMATTRHSRRLASHFDTLVGNDDTIGLGEDATNRKPPDILEIPSPAILHAYVRALGWMAYYNGLLRVTRWMVENKTEVVERSQLDRSGKERMRLVLVALRVFLERSFLSEDERQHDRKHVAGTVQRETGMQPLRLLLSAPEEVLSEVRELVESVDEWGGWPTDEEVDEYCEGDRFRQLNNTAEERVAPLPALRRVYAEKTEKRKK